MTVVWKDPPPKRGGIWAARLEPLLEKPGQWAVVLKTKRAGTASSYVYRLMNGELVAPSVEGHFEFRSHAVGDGSGEIYARFIGKEKPGATTPGSLV